VSGEILFLAHRLPFPPDRGDKIRSHHILKRLAGIAPVHVATFADTESDWAHEDELARLAESHCLAARNKPLPLAGIEALLRREPVSLAAFRNARLARFVSETLASRPVDTIYVFSGQMGQYIPRHFAGRVVVDLVDVDSAKFEAYAAKKAGPMRWVNAREGRLLRAEEERLAARADHTLLVSEAEAALLRSRLVEPGLARVSALGNGIDAEAFDPAKAEAEPELFREAGPHLVFTGQMDYAPNIAAAQRVIASILPAIRQHHPHAQFHVVGRAPVRELLVRHGQDGVRVWGEVPDVKPFLAAADLVIAPLDIARGVQNKVLEAMAMARPVVLTPGAATGIEAEDSVHFAVEESDAALAARSLALLANRGAAQAMGKAARQFVLDRQSWPATLAGLPMLLGREAPGGGQRDAA
jgi:sugar transferase (PEP-CTERM/EpsH1 system associated)